MVTADHGNAEQMKNLETGAPHTAHTTNPVPFIMTGDPTKLKFVMDEEKDGEDEVEEGALCDVAPTVLDLMVSTTCIEMLHVISLTVTPKGLLIPEGE